MRLLAIDPGPSRSAYVVVDEDCRPCEFGKVDNEDLLSLLPPGLGYRYAIEMVGSYGMPVGVEVFETCVWVGRFVQRIVDTSGGCPVLIRRLPVRLHHCHSVKANDATVRQALVDRFAPGVSNHGKGSKADPGWFYGFAADVWQAYALAVYAADTGVAA